MTGEETTVMSDVKTPKLGRTLELARVSRFQSSRESLGINEAISRLSGKITQEF